ncbi:MAG: effector-associated domain EAD1-containing protein [Caldilineaceae bacterium]
MSSQLSGKLIDAICTTIKDCFANEGELRIFVRTKLNEKLDTVAGGQNLSEIVFNLVEWAESKGRLLELAQGMSVTNPQNPVILSLIEKLKNPGIFENTTADSQSDDGIDRIVAFLVKRIGYIVSDHKQQIRYFSQYANVNLTTEYPPIEQVQLILSSLTLKSEAPICLGVVEAKGNWVHFMNHFVVKSKESIQKILRVPNVDSAMVNLLIEIDDCEYFNQVCLLHTLLMSGLADTDMSVLTNDFYYYGELCRKLDIRFQQIYTP